MRVSRWHKFYDIVSDRRARTRSSKKYRSRNTGARTVRLARRYNDIGNDVVIFAKWWWRTTMVRMEGDRGNRGKACLSSERGISRRYRAKPYVRQNPPALLRQQPPSTQLSQLLHPDYGRSRVIRFASRNYLRASSRISWKVAIRLRDLLPRTFRLLSLLVFATETSDRNSIEKLARSSALAVDLRDRTGS